VHYGKSLAPKIAGFLGVPNDELKLLRNWNMDVMENHYSTRFPLRAMRMLAGHGSDNA
jgi:hypothetical protein